MNDHHCYQKLHRYSTLILGDGGSYEIGCSVSRRCMASWRSIDGRAQFIPRLCEENDRLVGQSFTELIIVLNFTIT
jgi:hypothetical protein